MEVIFIVFAIVVIIFLILVLVRLSKILYELDNDNSLIENRLEEIRIHLRSGVFSQNDIDAAHERSNMRCRIKVLETENKYLKFIFDQFNNKDSDTMIITFKGTHYRITNVELHEDASEPARIEVTAVSALPGFKE